MEMVLKEEPGIELVGQASDGAEAVRMAGEALPDVVLMDVRMPKITGIEAARQVKEVAPSAKIVMLTISDEEEDDIDLVGQASDGTEAISVAGESLPDIVLMDIRMPKISGIEACRTIKEVAPSAKIVMLTISDEEEDLFEAIRAGASGYLLKDIPLDEVAEAVRALIK